MREIRLPLPSYAYRFDLLLEFARRIAYPARLIVAGETLWRFTGGRLLGYRAAGDAIVISVESLPEGQEGDLLFSSRRCLGWTAI